MHKLVLLTHARLLYTYRFWKSFTAENAETAEPSGFCRCGGLELRLKSFPAIVTFSFLLFVSSLLAAQEPQDKDADKRMQATPVQQANKSQKKEQKKDLKKDDK